MITYLEHVYIHLRANDLEATLQRFESAGFLRVERKVRHPAGNLTGFIRMTGTYLAFVSIVDEAEFEKEASPEDRFFRKNPQPYASGAVCSDPQLIFDRLSPIYPNLKPPYSRGETNSPDSPVLWTFCPLPGEATPGVEVFPLKYHSPKPLELTVGANSIFGFMGLVLCSDQIEQRLDAWEKTLKPVSWNFNRKDHEIEFGAQRLTWLTPDQYQQHFGAPREKQNVFCGEIAAIRLGAQSLETAKASLVRGGFEIAQMHPKAIATRKDLDTGYTFWIEQGDPATFLDDLSKLRQA